MNVLTFSRFYPKGHPKEGKPTHFVGKIWEALGLNHSYMGILPEEERLFFDGTFEGHEKHHTIRAGNRWKVGDIFSPRFWGNDINPKSGKSGPYQSKQLQFAPDIEIRKIWTFRISHTMYYVDEQEFLLDDLTTLAKNDGLSVTDFEAWFSAYPKKGQPDYVGQIICWNESIEYT